MMMIKSRTRWTGHAARTAKTRNDYKTLVAKPEGKVPLEDLGVDGRITLK
jgi:hypothetical protein